MKKLQVLLLLFLLVVISPCAIAEMESYSLDYQCDINQCMWVSPPPQRRHCRYGCRPKQTPFRGSRGPGVKSPPGKAHPPTPTPELLVSSPPLPQYSTP